MINIHDNEILSFEVDFQKCKITIRTIYENSDSITTVEFIDVLTHMFETQLTGSIILDISKLEVSRFIEHNKELLEKQKNYGWPKYYGTTEDLLEYLKNEQYNYYILSASYGLNGWVIAKNINIYN